MNKSIAPVCALALAAAAAGQTGRTMHLLAPALLGQTATFSMTYPVAAAGNIYVFLWSSPPFAGSTPFTVPGLTVHGVAFVDPNNFVPAFSGLLGPSGTVTYSLAVPNDPYFLGFAWDLQSIDLAIVSGDLYFADNELQLYISGNNIPSNMVPIAAGSFPMGSTQGNFGEQPVHTVTITRPFWMGKYEVTQAEYQAVMNGNPSSFPGATRPVEQLTWNEAMAYCAALTVQEAAANRLPSGYQYRLPTEAEWEYCCRAGTTTEWNTGISLSCAQANFYCVPFGQATAVVGSYAANAWGLHDMHGNVGEWCLDRWDASANYSAGPVSDPYVTSGPYRVTRGGSWFYYAYGCRSAYRFGYAPTPGYGNLGLRVVLAPVLL